jgi:hypothetical protein
MKKYMKVYDIFIVCLFLSGCITLETYIENVEYNYTAIPIITKHPWFFGEEFIMGDYSLNYKGNKSVSQASFGQRETEIRAYAFHRNKILLYRIEIVKWENSIKLTDSATLYFGRKRYIRIIDNNGLKSEHSINNDKKLPYITFRDDLDETININYYQTKNKNDIEHDWTYHTGFSIFVNNEEYGILAFYPVTLYLKNNNKMYNNIQDKLALFVLTTYASHLYK